MRPYDAVSISSPSPSRSPPAERDPDLLEKLKAEWPGILAWTLAGCLEWQRIGLAPPSAVTNATADYLDAEDSLAAWLAERTRKIGWGGTEAGRLFTDWSAWAKAAGEEPGSLKRFIQAIEAKGFRRTLNSATRRAEVDGLALAEGGGRITKPRGNGRDGSTQKTAEIRHSEGIRRHLPL